MRKKPKNKSSTIPQRILDWLDDEYINIEEYEVKQIADSFSFGNGKEFVIPEIIWDMKEDHVNCKIIGKVNEIKKVELVGCMATVYEKSGYDPVYLVAVFREEIEWTEIQKEVS